MSACPCSPWSRVLDETKKSILLYAVLLLALTTMFFATRAVGWVYLGSSLVLGLVFIYRAVVLLRRPGIEGALSTYLYSLAYLALLFTAIAVDASLA